MTDWRFIKSAPLDAASNMALDEALLHCVASGDSQPVLRVYSWSAPAVSLGYNQRCERELDLERCRRRGVQPVRRPTGGRTVYHSAELTYSVTGPGDSSGLGCKITETSRLICGAIRRSLAVLDVGTDSGGDTRKSGGHSSRLASPCFTSSSRYEITVGGKKLAGSAQRRMGDGRALLQQGSLLIKNEQARLAELMPGTRSEQERARLAGTLSSRVVGLEDLLHRPVTFDEVAEAFRQGFAGYFGCEMINCEPAEREIELAEKLKRERYGKLEWLLDKSGLAVAWTMQRETSEREIN